jgi:hypothetical protein
VRVKLSNYLNESCTLQYVTIKSPYIRLVVFCNAPPECYQAGTAVSYQLGVQKSEGQIKYYRASAWIIIIIMQINCYIYEFRPNRNEYEFRPRRVNYHN